MGEGDKVVESVVHGPPIAIANNDNGVTGVGVVGRPGFAERVLTELMKKLGPDATLRDLEQFAEPGTTVTSPDSTDSPVE